MAHGSLKTVLSAQLGKPTVVLLSGSTPADFLSPLFNAVFFSWNAFFPLVGCGLKSCRALNLEPGGSVVPRFPLVTTLPSSRFPLPPASCLPICVFWYLLRPGSCSEEEANWTLGLPGLRFSAQSALESS